MILTEMSPATRSITISTYNTITEILSRNYITLTAKQFQDHTLTQQDIIMMNPAAG